MTPDTEKAALVFAAALAGDVQALKDLLPPCGDAAQDGVRLPGYHVTPLMAAAATGQEGAVETLLHRGADPARRDLRGRTAAHYARRSGHHHLAERLDTVVDKERTIW